MDHPTIRTQYLLEPVSTAGRLFSPAVLDRMHGDHARQIAPIPGVAYVVGIDVAGQVLDAGLHAGTRILNDRDETVITGAAVEGMQAVPVSGLPKMKVVEHYRWRGLSHAEQYERMLRLLRDVWNVGRVAVDSTGIGAGIASFLCRAMPRRTDAVLFTSRSKSDLGFALLAAAETDRLKVYEADGSEALREFWHQLGATRYRLEGSEEMEFSVPAGSGHDDFVMSLALAVRAAEGVGAPAVGGIVRAQPGIDDMPGW